MKIIACEQGTPEWMAARCGLVTGSRVDAVCAKGKGSAPAATRETYLAELVAERLSGTVCQDGKFQSAAMKQGSEREAEARALYQFMRNAECSTVGFVLHPTIEGAGVSPDTLVGLEGLAEHKCPQAKAHLAALMGASIDGGYLKQMHWQMACTGRKWVDFVSYSPSFPDAMQLHIRRVPRDETIIAELEKEVRLFLAEVASTVESLRAKFLREAA